MRVVTTRDPTATLYMYTSDSPFSILMNSYMSDGTPVVPIKNGLDFGVSGNATRNSLSLSLFTNMTRTLSPTEFKLLDSK